MSLYTYESDDVYKQVRGETPPQKPVYFSEVIKEVMVEVKPNYPKLCDYEKEWLYFSKNNYEPGKPVDLEYVSIENVKHTTIMNSIPYEYKRAILKGSTEKVFSPLKNLFDGFLEKGSINNNTGALESGDYYRRNTNFIVVEPSTNYIISVDGAVNGRIYYYDINFNYIQTSLSADKALTPSNAKYMKFRISGNNSDVKVQVEKGKVITAYEEPNYILQSVKMPYLKTTNEDGTISNILTVNEDITLGSNGDVYDELNLLTGRLIQRIGEDGEVLSQAVVRIVNLSHRPKPLEGIMHLESNALLSFECPVVSTGEQTLHDINSQED